MLNLEDSQRPLFGPRALMMASPGTRNEIIGRFEYEPRISALYSSVSSFYL
jgi:hypothetical protein